ncbi:MAG TPA: hypothetical protein VL689_01060 [Paraburkholderia sp.]|jgi:Tfp pilus assembly protein PilN|nr:hypothetical protein [Paraburkholderia sp.]
MMPPLSPARRGIGGFNLMPWRRRDARERRRRVVLEWLAAALVGCVCAAPFAGWRVWQRAQLDSERRVLDASLAPLRAPLAQQRRLLREADERRQRESVARQKAEPLTRLFTLLDGLAATNAEGVSLDQVVYRAQQTELHATVEGETATAAWLARLRTWPELEAVAVREIKRATGSGVRSDERQRRGPLQVTVQLGWKGEANAPASHPPAGKQPRKRSGE